MPQADIFTELAASLARPPKARFDARNVGQAGVSFYTPAQQPATGTAADAAAAPTLFKPLAMRGLELHNRFVVSPMCQYSAADGHLTDYHLVHLGQFALHGAALVFVEATAVEPRGRISLQDTGIWADSHVEPLRRVANYVHSQNSKLAIQLAHASRKASTLAPWIGTSAHKALATEANGGWPSDVAPSPLPFKEGYAVPHELTVDDIGELVQSFARTARRTVQAGIDAIEIHGAHGYLITEFLSLISNKRTDEYGGSFENRIRFLREVTEAIHAVIPEGMPLWLRVSATEWMEHTGKPSWDLNETIRFAKLLPSWGIDVLAVSSGGNCAKQQITRSPTYQTGLAREIRRALHAEANDLLIAAVGNIANAQVARDAVEEGPEQSADLALAARQFLREPEFVLNAARDLGVTVKWPIQNHMAAPPDIRDAFF